MRRAARLRFPAGGCLLTVLGMLLSLHLAPAAVRDAGIDPWNLGKGDWIYFMSDATNRLGGNVASVTNENSLMLFYKSQGIRYLIVKAATSDVLFHGSYNRPQFTSNLCNIARSHGIWIMGYNRSYGENVAGEIAISDYVFNQGADGFVWDAEAEWESHNPWIGPNGPAKAWELCSAVRSNWPTKFLAHAPFPIISYHASFPYKEFGYWSDTVMPQIYHYGWTGVKRSPSGGINWSDVNWHNWQNSLYSLPPTNINGLTVHWTNAIKPLAPINHVYGPNAPPAATPIADKDVLEFIDYLAADPNPPTPGGYKGVSFWRTDLHGTAQWTHIKNATSGDLTGIVNHIIIDSPRAIAAGPWNSVRTFYDGSFYGGATDTNSFGTNYLVKSQGAGAAYVQFTPEITVAGDYRVYEWHPRRADASVAVPFLIQHSAGTNWAYANQKTNPGNWSLLGQFHFAAGTNGYIRIGDNVAEAGGVALADAVKLVFQAGSPQPAAPSGLGASAVSPTRIDLAWNDNSFNETSFVLARSTNSGGPYIDAATLPVNTTHCIQEGLEPNRTYYFVVRAVTAQGASTNSNQASATTLPPVPPAILVPPLAQSALAGQTVAFTVNATGTSPLFYQWRFSAEPVAGQTASTFVITNAQSTHAGTYSVTVSNVYGSVTSTGASLTLVRVGGWGNNNWGQAGVPTGGTNVIAVAAGGWHSLTLQPNGQVTAWGHNFQGQCSLPPQLSQIVALAGGGYHTLAIQTDGTVLAWGATQYGQSTVPQHLGPAMGIAAGTWHSLALRRDGTVIGWGDNTWGQKNPPAGLGNVIAVAAGGNHSLALKADGTVVAWGENSGADGLFAGQSSVPWGLSNVMAIAAGGYHSLALKDDGQVVAWGDNSEGQCAVPPGLANVVALAAGGSHSIALKADGSVLGWGSNGEGQCNVPAQLSNIVGIAAGERHTLLFAEESLPSARLLQPGWSAASGFGVLAQTLNRKIYLLEFQGALGASAWATAALARGNGALKLLADPAAYDGQRFYRMRQW